MEKHWEVRIYTHEGELFFIGQVSADDDYLRIEHRSNESSRVELRATAALVIAADP